MPTTPRGRAATRKRPGPALDLYELLPSWEVALRSDRKSRETIKSYTTGVYQFLDWCEVNGHEPALKGTWCAPSWFVAHLLSEGVEPATARARQLGVRRFSAWLEEDGEIDSDPLLGLKAPKLDTKVTNSLTDDEVLGAR